MAAPAMIPLLAVLLAAGDGPAPTPSLGAGAVAVSFQAPAFSEADALAAFEAGSQALVDARSAEAAAPDPVALALAARLPLAGALRSVPGGRMPQRPPCGAAERSRWA
jgi:hypothetical protein